MVQTHFTGVDTTNNDLVNNLVNAVMNVYMNTQINQWWYTITDASTLDVYLELGGTYNDGSMG